LLFAGIVLLLIEFLVLPGFGIAGILGVVCVMAGLFGMLIRNAPDELPWPETATDWQILSSGVLGLTCGLVGFIFLAWLLSRFLPKMQFLSGLILIPTVAGGGGGQAVVSMTAPPEKAGLGVEVGDIGEVIARLRPAGKARFGPAIVDVVAAGEFLAVGARVTIVRIRGNRVVVKKAEETGEA